jgi:hypothetical protein
VNEAFIRQIIGNGTDRSKPARSCSPASAQRHVDLSHPESVPASGKDGSDAGVGAEHQGAADAPGPGSRDDAQLAYLREKAKLDARRVVDNNRG